MYIGLANKKKTVTYNHLIYFQGSIISSSSEDSLMTAKIRLLNCDNVIETSLDQNEGLSGGGSGSNSKQKCSQKMKKRRWIPTEK